MTAALVVLTAACGVLVLACIGAAALDALDRRMLWDAHVQSALEQARQRHPSDLTAPRTEDDLLASFAKPASDPTARWRCWSCPGTPEIADPFVHSRLAHARRTPGPDDDAEFLRGLR